MKEVYLVTGASGHLGNTIVHMLLEEKKKVRCLVLPNDPCVSLKDCDCEIFRGDVTSIETIEKAFDVPEDTFLYVIHSAGIVSIASKHDDLVYNVNVNGTKNVVSLVMKHKNSKLVHISSVHAIYEKENHEQMKEITDFDENKVVGLYAKTKAIASKYVLEKTKEGLNACIVHPSGILGPNDYGKGHLTQLVIDYLNGGLTACVNGGYDFVDVRDVARGTINATKMGKSGECYILSNKYYKVVDILGMVSKITGKKKLKTVLPMWLAKLTAPLAELYYKILKQPPLYTSYSLYTLTSNSNFSNQKAKDELKYTTRDMEDTLYDMILFLMKTNRLKDKYDIKKANN